MRPPKAALLPLMAIAGVAALLGPAIPIVRSQDTATPLNDPAVVSFRVRLGVADTTPRAWDGTVTVSNGDLLKVRSWQPRGAGEIRGTSEWKLATTPGVNFQWRPWEDIPPTAPEPYLWAPGVIVDVKASAGTRLNFRTEQGRFSFNPQDVPLGRPASMLAGAVLVDRVPSAELLSSGEFQDDFVSMLSGREGEVWVCWAAYRDKGSVIMARRYDGTSWGPVERVTDNPADIFLPKMGRDKKGRPWVVWSEQVEGNWDLYGRTRIGDSWSGRLRITAEPQPDVFPNLATDSNGVMWLIWQGFRDGQADIFSRRYDGNSWSEPEQLSDSPANDWEPVIATDNLGRAYVAWDTYDKGSYDVVMRRFDGEKWSRPIPVADTPKYEAHPSLAVDGQGRLWAAWNESGTNWGKDTGFLLNHTQGTRLYEWRSIAVAVFDGESWQAPATDVNEDLPPDLQSHNDFPVLFPDAQGRIWLFARHRTLRLRDVPSAAPAHRAAWSIWGSTLDGDRWITPLEIPSTQGRMDMRWGLAGDGKGDIFAAWPTDNRDFREFLFQHADVYAARLPALPGRTQPPKLVARGAGEIPVFPIHPNERKDLGAINSYRVESGGKVYRILRGDTHRHTEFSMDGNNDGSLLQTYRYALDAAALDYLLVSEHNFQGGPDNEYINWLLQQMADIMTVSGRFQPFYGYERSLSYPNGHRNILFAERGNPTLPVTEGEYSGKDGAAALYDYLKRYGGIAISHTSATGMGTDWRDNDPEVEPLVEIYQGDRVSAEYEGAPLAAYGADLRTAAGGYEPAGYVWNAWAKGYKLGVQAASDHLSTHISYSCTIAEDFTRASMLDAMRSRHNYGATDNIILDYRLQSGNKEYLQGDIVTVPGDFRLWVKVIGTAPLRQIDIIRNQTFLHNRQNLAREVSFAFVDNDVPPGENLYYVRVVQVDGNVAWSSPIWVTQK